MFRRHGIKNSRSNWTMRHEIEDQTHFEKQHLQQCWRVIKKHAKMPHVKDRRMQRSREYYIGNEDIWKDAELKTLWSSVSMEKAYMVLQKE